MLAVKSSYLRNAVIRHVLREASFTMPANNFLALYTTNPTINDTGIESVGGSYARQLLSFANSIDGAKSSDTAETFTNMPASTITHWGIEDAVTGGNLLYFGAFDLPIQLNAGNNLTINSGDIVIGEV